MIGDATPMVTYPGVKVMIADPTAMSMTDSVNALRRPNRSANRPSRYPPMGRIRKPTAKIPAVLRNCAVWSPDGKNVLAK